MPTLMDLPNEILIAIIGVIEPDDIESFSTCCKLIHGLARQRLEEHEYKKSIYSTVLVSDSAPPFESHFRVKNTTLNYKAFSWTRGIAYTLRLWL